MFTGIVEQIGAITEIVDHESHRSMTLSGRELESLPIGASIAVDGVCLTAVEVGDGWLSVDVIPETLQKTTLGGLTVEDMVNLERPMPATGRFDGHIVQGHVDGVGVVRSVTTDSDGTVIVIEPPSGQIQFIVEKGSVTVDGVSLTVMGLTEDSFSVALIPYTLEVTTLGLRKAGDSVNLEMDVLAKYVERLLEARE